jgi:hypothetical protein
MPELASKIHFARVAERIEYYQRRNALSARCHTQSRVALLEAMGIDLRRIRHCRWPPDEPSGVTRAKKERSPSKRIA